MLSVTSPQLQRILRNALAARFAKKQGAFQGSIMVLGDTGIGKTDSIEHAFEGVKCPRCAADPKLPQHDIPVVTHHLSQMAPEDVKGLYVYSMKDDKVRLHPNPDFRLDSGCPMAQFLDEYSTVERPMQKSALEFTLKHSVGGTKLPAGSIVVLGGNRVQDQADVEEMMRPQRTRISFLEYQFNWDAWKDWALKAGVHPYVVGFLNTKPTYCYKPDVNAQHGEPLPRTWERTSEILYTFGNDDQEALINGTIGDGVAAEFMGWVATAGSLMPLVDRVLAGENVAAQELSAQFFVNSVLTDRYVRKPEGKMAERILQYAIYSADHNPEAAAVMQKDCCRVSAAHRDRMMGSPSWAKAVSRLSAFVV